MTYDIYKKNKLVIAKTTVEEAAKITGLAEKTVKIYSSTGKKSIDGFTICTSDVAPPKEEGMPEPLKSQWEEIRKAAEIIRSGRGAVVEIDGVKFVRKFAR